MPWGIGDQCGHFGDLMIIVILARDGNIVVLAVLIVQLLPLAPLPLTECHSGILCIQIPSVVHCEVHDKLAMYCHRKQDLLALKRLRLLHVPSETDILLRHLSPLAHSLVLFHFLFFFLLLFLFLFIHCRATR